MQQDLVSVVIPVYKVEKYLHRCVQSIMTQTYRNLEIILVDDGSPDNCPIMCDLLAASDSRIKVVHKENAGLGMARNTGIEHATGRYICFVDSDDYVDSQMVEKCVERICREQAQIVLYGYHKVDKNGSVVSSFVPRPSQLVYCGEAVQNMLLPDLMYNDPGAAQPGWLWISLCGALFSLELIRKTGWRSVSEREIISEDIYSIIDLYAYVEKVAVLKEAFYYYCENESSLTHTHRPDRFLKIKHFYTESEQLIRRIGYHPAVQQRLDMIYLSYVIATLKQEVAGTRPMRECVRAINAIVCDALTQKALKTGKNPHDSVARKLLLLAADLKQPWLCYIMLKAKG